MCLAIDPNPCVTRPEQVLQEALEVLIRLKRHGCQQQASLWQLFIAAGFFLLLHPAIENLIDRLGLDRSIALRAMLLAHPRIEHSEIIVNLRDCPDGRTGSVRKPFLFDRDRRGEPLDFLHRRLGHLPDELPHIRAQALDESSLPLGINRLHRQGGLTAPAVPTKDGHGLLRYRHIHTLEIVLRCSNHADILQRWTRQRRCYRFNLGFAALATSRFLRLGRTTLTALQILLDR